MSLISPNFDVKSIIFPNFGQGPFHKIAGKSPDGPIFNTGGGGGGGNWLTGWAMGWHKKMCKNGAKISSLTRSCICVLRTDFRMALYPGISFKTSSSIARESSPCSQSVSKLLM